MSGRWISKGVSDSSICIRCYNYGHTKEEPCIQEIVVSCSKCYHMNFLTMHCCELPVMDDNKYLKTVHLAGRPIPRFFMDVKIKGRAIAAMIHTNLSKSKVDVAVIHYLNQLHPGIENMASTGSMMITMRTNGKFYELDCDVTRLNDGILIHLGVDFLKRNKIILRLDGENLCKVKGHPLQEKPSRFFAVVKVFNKEMKAVIDTSLLQSRIYPIHVKKENGNIATIPVVWKGCTILLQCKVTTETYGSSLALGMDFLMQRSFSLILNGTEINVQGTWISPHQDMLEFVYNHPNGTALRNLLIVLGHNDLMEEDRIRPPLKRAPVIIKPLNQGTKEKTE